ncbi:MAG: patatin-like phospholipase family protein [Alphaproteobacteria bacterium]|nr:patatin-like phospholipase family protein [Alphaproteobacteria bacterium]MBU1513133.1 patatin-like phospholipase family protein [Alphaproteobacteria bacterium]MBU2095241.1 patatin-like phospholipase family protein [Alphaproteobacteria bacterium]MBU2152157.1 patatin-like phospholipase family protein [Alphaproteobacteria bacterium]MBU2306797.1 patatin-like phospholipase family protein [Alphaproteobacteria bacterium]
MPITAAECDRVLVLQGGGALGSYQAGVVQALAEADLKPGWVAGISIGAINAALIAGNAFAQRHEKLEAFWRLASSAAPVTHAPGNEQIRAFWNEVSAGWIAAFGVPGFFTPRVPPAYLYPPGSPQAVSLYDTAPLKATLEELVDFDRINSGETRLSVGAVNVRTGNFTYFDNTKDRIRPEHIMASGALPPGFPPVEIDGEHYWDGGIVSNTPLQYVLDEAGQRDLLIFQVDLFSARGEMPKTVLEAAEREKDIRFSSRTRLNTDMQMQLHNTKAALQKLIEGLPADYQGGDELALLKAFAHESSIAIVQLIYRAKLYEGNSKDYEFSRVTMTEHWRAGISDVRRTLQHRGWLDLPMKPGTTTYDLTGDGRSDANPP